MKNKIIFFISLILLTASCSKDTLILETTAMEGTIPLGSELQILPVKDIVRNQVIAFGHDDKYLGRQTGVLRVVGTPGDTIKISQGQVFVNGKIFPDPDQVKYGYQVIINGKMGEQSVAGMEYHQINSKEFVFYITDREVEKMKYNPAVVTLRILVRDYGNYQPEVFGADTLNNWNIDNYGPIKVPSAGEYGATEDHYFVLGDNRHNAIDSRYIGYIPKSDIIGLVKYK